MSPKPGEYWVVAARPRIGKTAWMCSAAFHTSAREGKVTAAFTLEQKRQDVIRRMLSQQTRLNYRSIQQNTLTGEDKALFLEYRAILAGAPLYVEDRPGLTVSRIRSKCERLKHKEGLDIVFIDQLSHVSRADVFQKGMPKHEQVGEQSRRLKLMARELDVPVVLLNQIGRAASKRVDPTPQLEDLAESGSLEQDCDVAILLDRPEVYKKDDETLRGKGIMDVAKAREGPTKAIHCTYNANILRWEEESRTEW
jgi:replicative DNA helicase